MIVILIDHLSFYSILTPPTPTPTPIPTPTPTATATATATPATPTPTPTPTPPTPTPATTTTTSAVDYPYQRYLKQYGERHLRLSNRDLRQYTKNVRKIGKLIHIISLWPIFSIHIVIVIVIHG